MTAAQVGAAGEIELDRDQKFGLRTGKVNKGDSVLLQGLDLVEDGKPIGEQVGPRGGRGAGEEVCAQASAQVCGRMCCRNR